MNYDSLDTPQRALVDRLVDGSIDKVDVDNFTLSGETPLSEEDKAAWVQDMKLLKTQVRDALSGEEIVSTLQRLSELRAKTRVKDGGRGEVVGICG